MSWTVPYNTHTYMYEIMLYIPMRLGRLCKHAQTHIYIIYKIMSVCCRALSEMRGNTHVYEIIFVRIYIPTRLLLLCAHLVCLSHVTYSFIHMCVPMHLGRHPTTHRHDFIYYIHVCMLTQPSKMRGNINSHTYNFIHMCVPTCLGQHPTTHQHDYIHVCPSMLTQPSKTCGNINSHTYNFVHMCVSTCLGRCPTIPTLICMKSCFIFPCVLDGCVSMLRHTYI